jgi:hypothetical protein
MKRSLRTRILGGVLLAIPIFGSIGVLLLDNPPEETWMLGPLLCSACYLFFLFVFPGKRGKMYRSLRPRDPAAIFKEA